jgi:pheromone shutdown protein TraB
LKDWRTADRSWSDPVATQAYTNQIARLSSEFRDLHMVKLLIDEVKQGKRVFAVVGGSHVVMQERALKAVSNGAP